MSSATCTAPVGPLCEQRPRAPDVNAPCPCRISVPCSRPRRPGVGTCVSIVPTQGFHHPHTLEFLHPTQVINCLKLSAAWIGDARMDSQDDARINATPKVPYLLSAGMAHSAELFRISRGQQKAAPGPLLSCAQLGPPHCLQRASQQKLEAASSVPLWQKCSEQPRTRAEHSANTSPSTNALLSISTRRA